MDVVLQLQTEIPGIGEAKMPDGDEEELEEAITRDRSNAIQRKSFVSSSSSNDRFGLESTGAFTFKCNVRSVEQPAIDYCCICLHQMEIVRAAAESHPYISKTSDFESQEECSQTGLVPRFSTLLILTLATFSCISSKAPLAS